MSRVRGETTVEQVANLLSEQLRELERFDPGVRLGDDAEDVHRFRVATRRARAIIRATRPLFGDHLASLGDELKWLAGLLGPVRDLDVLIAHLREECASLDVDRSAAERILAVLDGDRDRARSNLVAGLESNRYTTLLDAFAAAIVTLPLSKRPRALRRVARREVKRLSKAAAKLPKNPTDEQLHSLRKDAKHARYAAELATAEHAGAKLTRFVEELKDLQDTIGVHQDSVVARERIRSAASAASSDVGTGADGFRLRRRRRTARRARAGAQSQDAEGVSAGARAVACGGPALALLTPCCSFATRARATVRAGWATTECVRSTAEGRHGRSSSSTCSLGSRSRASCTSPYLRCIQTVEPLAQERGVNLELREELGEARQAVDGAELVRALAGANAVVCGHGGLERVLRSPGRFKKGAVLVVDERLEVLERLEARDH